MIMQYYSQYQQDYWVDKLLGEKNNGIFLDIGANDGVSISNTFFFEKNRNWTGICVEPIPEVYQKLIANRNCKSINACISDRRGKDTFYLIQGHNEMLSGLKSAYHDEHWKRILADTEKAGDKVTEFEVDCIGANDILEDSNYRHIDFLSIDTEGSEFKILETVDFDKFSFSIICVENPYGDPSFEAFLRPRGYSLCKIVDCDYLFVNKAEKSLWRNSRGYAVRTGVKMRYNKLKEKIKKLL